MGCLPHLVTNNEISAYLQNGCNYSDFFSIFSMLGSVNGSAMTESAKFNEPKPNNLQISDDTWASLKMRVDPMARAILDPGKLYLGSALLLILLGFASEAVAPKFSFSSGDDDDGYYKRGDDDFWANKNAEYNKWEYINTHLSRERMMWRIGFGIIMFFVVLGALALAHMMESRNERIDSFIKEVTDELADRFQQEGYSIEYKTRTMMSGKVLGHLFPERVMCFMELSDEEIGRRRRASSYAPPNTKVHQHRQKKESQFGTISVMVPDGYQAGQVVNVMTPSGLPIMVAVPSGVSPGQTFPVQIPAQMYRPRK